MATGVIRQSNHRFENLFFSGMAVLILATVFLGFARSYYLAGVFKAPLPNLIVHMLVFSTLIYFALRNRFNPAAHKRLILIATIALLDAAFVRWPIHVAWWDLRLAQMCCYPLLLLLIGYDLWSTRKVHRATLWASVFLIVLYQVRIPIGRTVPWQSFATWVQNLARSFH